MDCAPPPGGWLAPRATGVFWPQSDDPPFPFVGVDDPPFPFVGVFDPALPSGFPSSGHRLVRIDLGVA